MNTLTANRISLRPFVSNDADALAEAVRESVASVGEWLPWCRADFSRDDALSWFAECDTKIAAATAFDLGIFDSSSGRLIGSASVNRIDIDNRSGSIGYWVRKTEQRKGYCSSAVNRMKEFGFNELGLARLEIVVLVNNVASRQLAENCGAKLECVARNRLMHQGQPSAAAVYSLVSPT